MEREIRIGRVALQIDSIGRYRRGLGEALANPPKDREVRQRLLGLVSWGVFQRHPDLLVTMSRICEAAGLQREFRKHGHADEIAKVLNESGVPVSSILTKETYRGRVVKRQRRIILR